MPSLYVRQVRTLVKKDFWILKNRKKTFAFELILPLLLLAVTGWLLNDSTVTMIMGNQLRPETGFIGTNFWWWNTYVAPRHLVPRYFENNLRNSFPSKKDAINHYRNDQYEYDFAQPIVGLFGSNSSTVYRSTAQSIEIYESFVHGTSLAKFAPWLFNLYNEFLSVPLSSNWKYAFANQIPRDGEGQGPLKGYNVTRQKELYQFQVGSFTVPSINIGQMLATFGTILVSFAFFALLVSLAVRLVEEKRTKMREHLRVMGVKPSTYLTAVFCSGLLRVAPIGIIAMLLLGAVGGGSVGMTFSLGFLCFSYGLSLISFAMLLPAFFSRGAVAAAICTLFLLAGTAGGIFVTLLPAGAQLAIGFFVAPVTFVSGCAVALGGFSLSLPITVPIAIVFLLLQTVIYTFLGYYLCAVFPGDYGIPQHPLFPFYMIKRWVLGKDANVTLNTPKRKDKRWSYLDSEATPLMDSAPKEGPHHHQQQHQQEQQRKNSAILLDGLVKSFGSENAVDGLSLEVHQGEVFALLGHNGAGKTTTISMLTGMLEATRYDTADILGMDLSRDIDLIRLRTGVCPQFDILFEDLSALQHMEIFSAIKGSDSLTADVVLTRLDLPWTSKPTSTYSGGMKRRLSVGGALAGDASLVFLDEPSSGLDPMSRRQLWELVHDLRADGKTIVLTTHFMEEADYLGDRIGIMAKGKLHCCSTSAGLKHEFGVGYYLTLVKAMSDAERAAKESTAESSNSNANTINLEDDRCEGAADCGPTQKKKKGKKSAAASVALDSSALLVEIKKYCPGAKLHHESSGDVQYLLPTESVNAFGELLNHIESIHKEFGATSYGLRMNTLEDVFVTVSHQLEEDELRAKGELPDGDTTNSPICGRGSVYTHLPDGRLIAEEMAASLHVHPVRLFFSHVWTIFVKKARFLSRAKRTWFLGFVVPIVLIIVGFCTVFSLSTLEKSFQNSYYNYQYQALNPAMWTPTEMPDIHHWVVPTLGPLSDEQTALLDKAAQLYPRYIQTLDPTADPEKAVLEFKQFSGDEMRRGSYIQTKTLYFADWQAKGQPIQVAFANKTHMKDDWIYGYGTNHKTPTLPPRTPVTTSDCPLLHVHEYNNPTAALFMVNLLYMARVKLQVTETDRAPVWPNYTVRSFPMFNLSAVEDSSSSSSSSWNTWPSSSSSSSSSGSGLPTYFVMPLGFILVFAMAQYAANASLQVADEVQRHVFQTLRMHGMSALAYWTGTLLFDAVIAIVLVGCVVGGIYIRGIEDMESSEYIPYLCIQIIGFSIHTLLLAYALISAFPKWKPSRYIFAILGLTLLQLLLPVLITAFVQLGPRGSVVVSYTLSFPPRAVQMCFPFRHAGEFFQSPEANGAMASVWYWCVIPLLVLYRFSTQASRDHRSNVKSSQRIAAAMNTRRDALEKRVSKDPKKKLAGMKSIFGTDDPDVLEEEKRIVEAVKDSGTSTDMVTAMHLRQDYKGKNLAVKQVTFGVRPGECFGLLGPNGAGKTSTVQMLLQEHAASSGVCAYPYAPDVNMGTRSLDNVYRNIRIGVCQQSDTLWGEFTDQEHLDLYLRCRLGPRYNAEDYKNYIEASIKKMYLQAKGKLVEQYSGGMKRKLAVCIALYTGGVTIFLDEPSTGMDPYARRAMWRSIGDALREDHCVLLTTHSMEEADAMCSRIAIVIDGQMKCLGNSQHLKNRFGSGYSITLVLKEEQGEPEGEADEKEEDEEDQPVDIEMRAQQLDWAMKEVFGLSCERTELVASTLRYSVSQVSVARAFAELASHQEDWGLESYGVSQVTSLDDVFLRFSSAHHNPQ